MRRRYDRSRRYGGARWRWLGVILCLVVVAGVVPAASYTSADVDRSVSANVVSDSNGIIQLEKQNPVIGETGTLATITNRFDSSIEVTVSLREGYSSSVADISSDAPTYEWSRTIKANRTKSVPICVDGWPWISPGRDIQFEFEFESDDGGFSGATEAWRTVTLEGSWSFIDLCSI